MEHKAPIREGSILETRKRRDRPACLSTLATARGIPEFIPLPPCHRNMIILFYYYLQISELKEQIIDLIFAKTEKEQQIIHLLMALTRAREGGFASCDC